MTDDQDLARDLADGPDEAGLEDLREAFTFLDDWEERYGYLIDLGRRLPPLPEVYKSEDYRVEGCVSKVWLVPRSDAADPERLLFSADSDAHIVRGLVAIILMLYSGKTAQEIIDLDAREVLADLDLEGHLSPSRSNGFYAMVRRIRQMAERRLHGLPVPGCVTIQ